MLTTYAAVVREAAEPARESIVLIDSEPLSRDCFAEALSKAFGLTRVIAISSVEELRSFDDSERSLIVVKATHAAVHGTLIHHVREVVVRYPQSSLVVIAPCDDRFVAEVIAAGAQGLIPVTAPLKVGVAALRLVMAGGTYFPVIDGRIPQPAERPEEIALEDRPDPLDEAAPAPQSTALRPIAVPARSGLAQQNSGTVKFTARETEVLAALQGGRSNKWIASQLRLSENTVKVHIRHIMRKLHATNRTQAVIFSQNMVFRSSDLSAVAG